MASIASFMSVAFLPREAGGTWTGVSAYSWRSDCQGAMVELAKWP